MFNYNFRFIGDSLKSTLLLYTCISLSLIKFVLDGPYVQLLKPAFTIICDHGTKCFLLLIRGTHSVKDTLTAATGAVVPFHHSVLHDGGISNLILGYAHCGMVAAARWIAKLSTPCLIKALNDHPDYHIKVYMRLVTLFYIILWIYLYTVSAH